MESERRIDVPDVLWQRLERRAVEEGRSVDDLAGEALHGYLDATRERPRAERRAIVPGASTLDAADGVPRVSLGELTMRQPVGRRTKEPLSPRAYGQLVELQVHHGDEVRTVSDPRWIIGRGADAHLQLDDPELDEEHAQVEFLMGLFFLVDMGSSQGCSYDGQPIQRKPIVDEDRIHVGNQALTFRYVLASTGRPISETE